MATNNRFYYFLGRNVGIAYWVSLYSLKDSLPIGLEYTCRTLSQRLAYADGQSQLEGTRDSPVHHLSMSEDVH
jgi:hypothetical protein